MKSVLQGTFQLVKQTIHFRLFAKFVGFAQSFFYASANDVKNTLEYCPEYILLQITAFAIGKLQLLQLPCPHSYSIQTCV